MFATRLHNALFRPVDAASLVVFRIAFGFIMLVEAWRYLTKDWIERYYILPEFHFKYYGFEWVEPWSGDGMYWHFVALGVLSLCIMLGAFYRAASVLFFLGFSYVFLLDQAQYLNHFYLVILISFLMCFLPANRAFSLDARLWPSMASQTVPGWAVWTLVVQFEVMYLYAGFVKINPDWLALEPLGMWLNYRSDLPVVGPYFAESWVIAAGAYGVIALHLIGAPLLLWRKTRATVFVIYALFHLSNHVVFQIGIFPWFTLVGTLMFFDPDWPRQLARWALRQLARLGDAAVELQPAARSYGPAPPVRWSPRALAVVSLLAIWFTVQVTLPLRHYLYPGDVAWNEDGHRFSWRMKLRDKKGDAEFVVRDPVSGEEWYVEPEDYLSPRQARKMRTRPDMLLQFAHYLERIHREEQGLADVEVRAEVEASLNGRPYATLVDPDQDLTLISRADDHADWILPLTVPLPQERAWARN